MFSFFPHILLLFLTHDLQKQIQMISCNVQTQTITIYVILELSNTNAVHPADVSRSTGKDGGFLVGVAAKGRHKAGHSVDHPLAVDTAIQGATRITLYK